MSDDANLELKTELNFTSPEQAATAQQQTEQTKSDKPRKKQKRSTSKARVPGWIKWTRSIGAFSVFAGGIGLMQPQYFWFGVGFIYAGVLLLGLDLWYEPELRRSFKYIGESVVVAVVVLITWRVAFVSAPLNIQSLMISMEYSSGTKIADIPWRPMYTELDVAINNPTEADYTEVNLVIKADYPVAAISQLSNLGGVSFEDRYGSIFRGTIQDLGTTFAIPTILLATDAGYRIHADHIPPNSSLRVVMAIVDMKKAEQKDDKTFSHMLKSTEPCDFSIVYSLRDKITGEEFKYWNGCPQAATLFGERPRPKKMHVSGSYTANNRSHHIDQQITIPQGL